MEMNFSGRFYFISFILFFLFVGGVRAQHDADVAQHGLSLQQRQEMAIDAIKAIKEGVLIVRLSSESRKIGEINKLLLNPDIDGNRRERLEKMKEATLSKARERNFGMYEAFSEIYTFSEVLFMYDTSVYNLTNGLQSGYFLDENLVVKPDISLSNKSYRVLRFGWPYNSASNEEGFYVMDTDYKDLPKPFPDKFRTVDFFRMLFTKSNRDSRWKDRVSYFEKRLGRFYNKLNQKGMLYD